MYGVAIADLVVSKGLLSPSYICLHKTLLWYESRRAHGESLMENRKCERCGVDLTDKEVMKIKDEDGSWHVIPLPLCPSCFTEQLRRRSSGS